MYSVQFIEKEEFRKFSETFPGGSFVQSVPMAEMREELGNPIKFVGIFSDGTLLGAGFFYYRSIFGPYKIAECHQGPLLEFKPEIIKAFAKGLKEIFKKDKVIRVHLLPNFLVREHDIDGELVEGGFDNRSVVKYLEAVGFKHQGYQNDPNNPLKRWFFMKDLSEITNEKELMNSFPRQTTRWQVRKTLKYDFEIREMSYEELPEFLKIMDDTSERHEFHHRSIEYYQSLYKHLHAADMFKLYAAYLNVPKYKIKLEKERDEIQNQIARYEADIAKQSSKKLVNKLEEAKTQLVSNEKSVAELDELEGEEVLMSAAMFVTWNNEMTYLFSGAFQKYMNFGSPYALQWKSMNEAIKKGVKRYNFYGTLGKWVGVEDDGVYQFKKGFGGTVIEQPGSFMLTINPVVDCLYEAVKSLKSKIKKR